MARAGGIALWAAGLWIACALPVRAQSEARLPLELTWQAPAECPTAAAMREELERITRVAPGATLTPLAASARVERRAGAYAVQLVTERDGLRGERALTARDCKTLARTVTLVLALAFGSGVEVEEAEAGAVPGAGSGSVSGSGSGSVPGAGSGSVSGSGSDSVPESGSDSDSEPDSESDSDSDSDSDSESESDSESDSDSDSDSAPLDVILLLGAGAQLGPLPGTAFAGTAGIELAGPVLSLGLRATGWPGVAEAAAADAEAHYSGVGGALYGCGQQALADFALSACASFRAAALRAASSGALEQGARTAPWYALGAGAGLTYPRAGLVRVRVEGALAVSLDRARFVIDNLAEVHHVPWLSVDANLLLLFAL